MRNYIILNGISSNTISGLLISTLPSISKPKIRTQTEEIDGRDGDIVTKLGYSAYDKEIEIGLYGNFDINEVIEYFNSEGTVVFSNENDKYYNYQILEQIDFEKLIRFKTAKVKMHVQPFKYPTEETPVEIEYQYVTGEGTNITLDNTDNALMQLDLNPSELTRATRSGKNILALNLIQTQTINGITLTNLDNGTILVNGTTTSSTIIDISYQQTLKANVEYKFINFNAYSTSNANINIKDSQDNTINAITLNLTNKTFTPNTDTEIAKMRFYIDGNQTFENYTLKVMLIKSSDNDSWEPYGVMPSPDYPSEVQVIKGNNSIKIENKNLFDKNNVKRIYGYIQNNTTWKYYNDSYSIRIPVKPNTNYVISADNSNETIFRAGVTDSSNIPVLGTDVALYSTTRYSNTNTPIYITTGANAKYIVIQVAEDSANDTFNTLQLEKGTQATTYEPHQEQVLPLNLPNGIEYCKIGTYEDEFEHDGDKWYLNKYIGKIVLDGSESYTKSMHSDSNYCTFITNDFNNALGTNARYRLLSNYFVNNDIGSSIPNKTGMSYLGSNFGLRFSIEYSNASDVTGFKTWLSTHNTEVYYVLETPTHEEITDTTLISQLNAIEKALSYDEQTNISQTNTGLPFIISASALEKGSNTATVNNTGNIYSKPTIDIEGSGTVDIYLNNNQMFSVDLSNSNECVIDTTNLEAYNPSNSALMNRQVTGDYSNFKLNTGENAVKVNGNVTKVTITDYTRWL